MKCIEEKKHQFKISQSSSAPISQTFFLCFNHFAVIPENRNRLKIFSNRVLSPTRELNETHDNGNWWSWIDQIFETLQAISLCHSCIIGVQRSVQTPPPPLKMYSYRNWLLKGKGTLFEGKYIFLVLIQFNSIQFNSILLSIPGKLFCLHAYIKYIGTYIEHILTIHRFNINS